jgi:hypothetical protein
MGSLPGKNYSRVKIGSKANDYINIFYVATFFEFLAASNAMVADESGVRR